MLNFGKWPGFSSFVWLRLVGVPRGWAIMVANAQYGYAGEVLCFKLWIEVVWQVVHVVHSGSCRNYIDSTVSCVAWSPVKATRQYSFSSDPGPLVIFVQHLPQSKQLRRRHIASALRQNKLRHAALHETNDFDTSYDTLACY